MKDWSKERWRKLYLREALQQRLWPVMARGLRDYLIRLAEDDGVLIRDADDPLQALLQALGAQDGEVDLVRGALELLCTDGFLTRTARSIFVLNLPAAQSWKPRAVDEVSPDTTVDSVAPATSTERVRRHRERLRQMPATHPPTLRSATGIVSDRFQAVTSRVSPGVTSVTSGVSCNVPARVSPSRGSRKLNSSESFLDLQRNNEIDHLQSSTRASSVSPSVTSDVSPRSVPPRTAHGEEEDEERSNCLGSPEEPQALPISARPRRIVDCPSLAEVLRPESWPEVLSVAQKFARSAGTAEPRLGRYQRDSGVRAIVELYAAGFTQREIEQVVESVPKQSWWSASSKRLGLSSFTAEVIRRNLPEDRGGGSSRSALSPRVAKLVAEIVEGRKVG